MTLSFAISYGWQWNNGCGEKGVRELYIGKASEAEDQLPMRQDSNNEFDSNLSQTCSLHRNVASFISEKAAGIRLSRCQET